VADLADFGQTLDALSSVDTGIYGKAALNTFDAIVHLAAIPAPRRFTDPVTFSNNTLSTYNVFEASRRLGIKNKQFCRWDPEMKIIGLRFSNVMEPGDYAAFPDFERDPQGRKWNLWGYIDARDAAQAIRRALEAPLKGAEIFVIANADTVMTRPTSELLAELFPKCSWEILSATAAKSPPGIGAEGA
jgi:nucleoside-diphosphate-sugar epimerase